MFISWFATVRTELAWLSTPISDCWVEKLFAVVSREFADAFWKILYYSMQLCTVAVLYMLLTMAFNSTCPSSMAILWLFLWDSWKYILNLFHDFSLPVSRVIPKWHHWIMQCFLGGLLTFRQEFHLLVLIIQILQSLYHSIITRW